MHISLLHSCSIVADAPLWWWRLIVRYMYHLEEQRGTTVGKNSQTNRAFSVRCQCRLIDWLIVTKEAGQNLACPLPTALHPLPCFNTRHTVAKAAACRQLGHRPLMNRESWETTIVHHLSEVNDSVRHRLLIIDWQLSLTSHTTSAREWGLKQGLPRRFNNAICCNPNTTIPSTECEW